MGGVGVMRGGGEDGCVRKKVGGRKGRNRGGGGRWVEEEE